MISVTGRLSALSHHSWTYTLVVDDLNDGGESAFVRALGEDANAANLDRLPGACRDFGRHCDGACMYGWCCIAVAIS